MCPFYDMKFVISELCNITSRVFTNINDVFVITHIIHALQFNLQSLSILTFCDVFDLMNSTYCNV
jgi:hypothetical protein